jgi:hypothetical protein
MPQQNRSHLIPTTGLLHTHYEAPCRHNVPPTPTTSLSSHGQGKDNIFWLFRATLDEGPRSRDQWIQTILLVKSFKLVPRPFRQGSKTKKWQIKAKPTCHLFWRERSTGLDQRTVLKWELLIWRTKNQARDQGTVQLKDSICFKSVQIGS